jgi:hypothetical protein
MWLRFETKYRHGVTRWGIGVLRFVPEILDDPEVDRYTKNRVEEICEWLNYYLPRPRGKIEPHAIFWFKTKPDLGKPARVKPWKRRPLTKRAARTPKVKIPSDRDVDLPDAAECISKMRHLTMLVRMKGIHVRVITTNRPGYIVYEDPFQVAAIPFRDTRREMAF